MKIFFLWRELGFEIIEKKRGKMPTGIKIHQNLGNNLHKWNHQKNI